MYAQNSPLAAWWRARCTTLRPRWAPCGWSRGLCTACTCTRPPPSWTDPSARCGSWTGSAPPSSSKYTA
eukprot:9213091-Pyramimonas_sp.AAC.1